MATGLQTFDAFSWASLLKGWLTLVIDRRTERGRSNAAALEEAGALATFAPGQAVGMDRLRDGGYRLVVLALDGDEAVGERIAAVLANLGGALVVLAEPGRHAALRGALPSARIAGHGMGERDLVLFITGSADE